MRGHMQLAHERGPAAAAAQEVAGAGGPQESQGGVWRRPARWRGGGLNHDPPQQYGLLAVSYTHLTLPTTPYV